MRMGIVAWESVSVEVAKSIRRMNDGVQRASGKSISAR